MSNTELLRVSIQVQMYWDSIISIMKKSFKNVVFFSKSFCALLTIIWIMQICLYYYILVVNRILHSFYGHALALFVF